MALTFPSSPTIGAQYTDANNVTWIFDGVGWEQQSTIVGDYAVKNSPQTFTAGQAGEITSIAYAASIALNLALSNNFEIGALTGNITLTNPTNILPGQSGCIRLTQDGTGGRTISFGSAWGAAGGIAGVTLSTAAGSKDVLTYYVMSSTEILVAIAKAVA